MNHSFELLNVFLNAFVREDWLDNICIIYQIFGIPQGSPVSPIMFLIFIQHVIGALEHRNEIVTLSYADDLAMVTESSYARINNIRL